jgi:hypothetical protein
MRWCFHHNHRGEYNDNHRTEYDDNRRAHMYIQLHQAAGTPPELDHNRRLEEQLAAELRREHLRCNP